ncbi:MAG: hypothetical protein ABSB69_14365 [Solirubrobacteraceae bacterium]
MTSSGRRSVRPTNATPPLTSAKYAKVRVLQYGARRRSAAAAGPPVQVNGERRG